MQNTVRWLAIISNLVWGLMSLTIAAYDSLSGESVTDSEQRVAYVGGVVALLAVAALMLRPRGVAKNGWFTGPKA